MITVNRLLGGIVQRRDFGDYRMDLFSVEPACCRGVGTGY
jgi:hypothetical protein